VKSKIKEIFKNTIGVEVLDDSKLFNEIDGWDSLKHVQFVIELEQELYKVA
jgi:acyl carrier protein